MVLIKAAGEKKNVFCLTSFILLCTPLPILIWSHSQVWWLAIISGIHAYQKDINLPYLSKKKTLPHTHSHTFSLTRSPTHAVSQPTSHTLRTHLKSTSSLILDFSFKFHFPAWYDSLLRSFTALLKNSSCKKINLTFPHSNIYFKALYYLTAAHILSSVSLLN